MSKWRVGIDCGEWFVSEIGDQWGGGESFGTEAEAVAKLREIQARGLASAESDLEIARSLVKEKRRALESPPRISRMSSPSRSDG